jgi:hypothetical protein
MQASNEKPDYSVIKVLKTEKRYALSTRQLKKL